MDKKNICFLGSSKEDIVSFPHDARRESGYQLGLLQAGEGLMIGSLFLASVQE